MYKLFARLMLLLVALLLLLPFFGCQERDPFPLDTNDATQLEGFSWVDMTGTLHPDWHYAFQDGLLTQSFIDFGLPLTSLEYPYALRSDTVIIGGNLTNPPRIWVLEFECADVVQVRQVGAVIGGTFWLKRQ